MATMVIPGAAGALGGAVARTLAGAGHRVALLGAARAEARLAELATALGGNARAYAADSASPAELGALARRIAEELGAPAGVVVVAGGWQGGGALHSRADDGVYRAMLSQNLDTVHAALRAFVPGMVAARTGSIVVVGSRAAVEPHTSAGLAEYAASKAAVVALARAVAAEVLADGVRVNAVLPGTLDTPANRKAMPNADASRWVTLESAANVIAFLLSDGARDVTGATLPLYGRS